MGPMSTIENAVLISAFICWMILLSFDIIILMSFIKVEIIEL